MSMPTWPWFKVPYPMVCSRCPREIPRGGLAVDELSSMGEIHCPYCAENT